MRILTNSDLALLQLASAGQFTMAELKEHARLENVVDAMLLLIKLQLVEPHFVASKQSAVWMTTPTGDSVLEHAAAHLPKDPPWMRLAGVSVLEPARKYVERAQAKLVSAEDEKFLKDCGIRVDEDLTHPHQ